MFTPCLSHATLPPNLAAEIGVSGARAYEIEDPYGCELNAGHDGAHFAVVDTADSLEAGEDWWVRWDDSGDVSVERKPMCEAEHPHAEDAGICMLYDGHPGQHVDECGRWPDPTDQES